MGRIVSYYYLTESSRSPVREFIDSLDFKTQRKFFFVKELLEEFGKVIFTNGFIKKSGKAPRNEIETAMERRNRYLNKLKGDD